MCPLLNIYAKILEDGMFPTENHVRIFLGEVLPAQYQPTTEEAGSSYEKPKYTVTGDIEMTCD